MTDRYGGSTRPPRSELLHGREFVRAAEVGRAEQGLPHGRHQLRVKSCAMRMRTRIPAVFDNSGFLIKRRFFWTTPHVLPQPARNARDARYCYK